MKNKQKFLYEAHNKIMKKKLFKPCVVIPSENTQLILQNNSSHKYYKEKWSRTKLGKKLTRLLLNLTSTPRDLLLFPHKGSFVFITKFFVEIFMSEHLKWCETFRRVIWKKFRDVCVSVCIKTLENSGFCISGITWLIELKLGVHLKQKRRYRVGVPFVLSVTFVASLSSDYKY